MRACVVLALFLHRVACCCSVKGVQESRTWNVLPDFIRHTYKGPGTSAKVYVTVMHLCVSMNIRAH